MLVTALILSISYLNHNKMSDEEVKKRAKELGMVESTSLIEASAVLSSDSGEVAVTTKAPTPEPERESYYLYIAEDNMSATIRFYAPTVGGELLTFDELMKDFKYRYIEYGIQEETLKEFFLSKDRPYCTDIIAAKGLVQ